MYYNGYHDYSQMHHLLGLGILGAIFVFLLWIVAIVFIVKIIRRLLWGSRWQGMHDWKKSIQGNTALDLLNERYVKGEINKEEYEQKKKDVSS